VLSVEWVDRIDRVCRVDRVYGIIHFSQLETSEKCHSESRFNGMKNPETVSRYIGTGFLTAFGMTYY